MKANRLPAPSAFLDFLRGPIAGEARDPVVAVIAGPLVYKVPIDDIDFKAKLRGPSWAHPLGTDDLGQDILARILYGGRISLAVGVVAMLIGICVGTTIGATAGQFGGAVDNALISEMKK